MELESFQSVLSNKRWGLWGKDFFKTPPCDTIYFIQQVLTSTYYALVTILSTGNAMVNRQPNFMELVIL